ncbi:unnamed protein product [Arctogadus glacialis]
MLSSAQQMLQESRSKIESLRLQILKAAQSGETEEGNLSPQTDVSRRTELQHYIQRESDALALATDIASSLQDLKNMEPSASTEALVRVCDTTRRLELLKTSLDRCQEEPRDHVPSLPPSTEHASLSSSPSTLLTKPACLTAKKIGKIIKTIVKMKPTHLLMAVDFNMPSINWTTVTTTKGQCHMSQPFLETNRDTFLDQHINQST